MPTTLEELRREQIEHNAESGRRALAEMNFWNNERLESMKRSIESSKELTKMQKKYEDDVRQMFKAGMIPKEEYKKFLKLMALIIKIKYHDGA